MIPLFEKSQASRRNGFAAAAVVSVLYAVYVYFTSGFTLRLISALAFFALFYSVASFIAYFTAVSLHQKLLAILYNDADPKRFITAYTPLLARPKLSSMMILTLKAHLANAHANLGQTKAALKLLDETEMPSGKQMMDAELLIAGNRLSYYLLAEDIKNAKKACDALDALIKKYQSEGKKLNQSYLRSQKLYHIHLDILQAKPLNESPLYQELQVGSNNLHRVGVQYQLGRLYLEKGDLDTAMSYLSRAAKYPSVVLGQRAAALLKTIK